MADNSSSLCVGCGAPVEDELLCDACYKAATVAAVASDEDPAEVVQGEQPGAEDTAEGLRSSAKETAKPVPAVPATPVDRTGSPVPLPPPPRTPAAGGRAGSRAPLPGSEGRGAPAGPPPPAVTLAQVKAASRAGERDPYEGRVLDGQYRIIRRLGIGGMGAVYLAEQLDVGREVALKVLLPSPGHTSGKEARFNREAKAASILSHVNIATVYNFGRFQDGSLFIAMENVKGTSLGSLLKAEGALPLERALSLGRQMADGLAEAHSKAIVHRDLKPDNVLLTASRQGGHSVKIVDFGIAVVLGNKEPAPSGGKKDLVRGTPIYMSPEQARGDSIDFRSDIYSLGVILFYMLSGQYPIKADSPVAYLKAHQVQLPPRLSRICPYQVPHEIDQLVMGCLEKRPESRPASMEAILEVLEPLLSRLLEAGRAGVDSAEPDYLVPESRPAGEHQALGEGGGGPLQGDEEEEGAEGEDWGASYPQGRGGVGWIFGLVGVMFLIVLGVAVHLYFNVLENPEMEESALFLSGDGTPALAVKTNREALPPWLESFLQKADHEADEGGLQSWPLSFPMVAVSGPAPNLTEGRRQVLADAMERSAAALLRREAQDNEAARAIVRKLEAAEVPVGEALSQTQLEVLVGEHAQGERVRSILEEAVRGKEEVARSMVASVWPDGVGPTTAELYWERFPAGEGEDRRSRREFYLVWGQVSMEDADLERLSAILDRQGEVVGMSMVDMYPALAWLFPGSRGVFVHRVDVRQQAYRSGVRQGDVIVEVDRRPVLTAEALEKTIGQAQLGDTLYLDVLRPVTGEPGSTTRHQVSLTIPRTVRPSPSRTSPPRGASPRTTPPPSGGSITE